MCHDEEECQTILMQTLWQALIEWMKFIEARELAPIARGVLVDLALDT